MFERIIVPLDGSRRSESIIPEALRFFHTPDVEINLLVVVDMTGKPEEGRIPVTCNAGTAKEYLARLAPTIRASGLRVSTDVRFGRAAEKILEHAEDAHASLIAMGTHGRSGLSRLVRGSVAESVLRGASIPILLLRAQEVTEAAAPERTAPRRILVPLDGSADAESVLPYVRYLAIRTGCEVEVLRAALPIPVLEPLDAQFLPDPVPGAAAYLESIRARLHADGIESTQVVTSGAPADGILARANSGDVQLVAMATHGHSGLRRLLLGSVAEAVMRSLTVPLLAMRVMEHPVDARSFTAGNLLE